MAKLGQMTPGVDASTSIGSQIPVEISQKVQDQSTLLGERVGGLSTEEVINLIDIALQNKKLYTLLDVSDLLDNAPIGSLFVKGSDGLWTYGSQLQYTLPTASSTVLGGVKIGDNLNIVNGVLNGLSPYEYFKVQTPDDNIAQINSKGVLQLNAGSNISISGLGNIITISASLSESDPVFNAWDKSTGISITESQISDLRNYLLVEADPVFLASAASGIQASDITRWNSNISYTHPTQAAINASAPVGNVIDSISVNTLGHVTAITTRQLTSSDLTLTEVDPVFTAWNKSDGIFIYENQILDLQPYLLSETDPIFSAWDKSTGISITESQISNLKNYLLTETDPVFLASAAHSIQSADITRWNSYTNYIHPTQSGIDITTSSGSFLSAISVNSLGHTTSVSTRQITTNDLPFDLNNLMKLQNGGVQDVSDTVVFQSYCTFPQVMVWAEATGNIGVQSKSGKIGLYGIATPSWQGYGVVGESDYIPIQATNTDAYSFGSKSTIVLAGVKPSIGGTVQPGYQLDIRWDLPQQSSSEEFNKVASYFGSGWESVTPGSEKSNFIFRCATNGVVSQVAKLNSDKLIVNNLLLENAPKNKYLKTDSSGNVIGVDAVVDSSSSVYNIRLPKASSVSGRCALAVSGVDYPAGWYLASGTSPNDLIINHSLDKALASIFVFADLDPSERLLIGSAAYGGVVQYDTGIIFVENFATYNADIYVRLIFTNALPSEDIMGSVS